MKIGQFTVSDGNDEQHILFFEKMGTECFLLVLLEIN